MLLKFLVVSLLIVLAAVVFAFVRLKTAKRTDRLGVYRGRKLMTDNEREFFGRLVLALPNHDIFPQVAMSALLEAASRNRKQAYADHLRIAQQRVDYVVCAREGDIVAVIELDDSTHSHAKDRQRDARLAQAGIRTIRFQSRRKPSPAEIMVAVLQPATGGAEAASQRASEDTAPVQ